MLLAGLLGACSGGPEPAALAPEPPAPAAIGGLAAGGEDGFASYSHVCARVDDTVQCWGAGRQGQVGDGRIAARRWLPARVELPGPATALAAGGSHTCAVVDGAPWCWGTNARRQLGVSGLALGLRPQPAGALPRPVDQLAAGAAHTCARGGGALWCWGAGDAGQLGAVAAELCRSAYRGVPCSAQPVRVEGLSGAALDLALGDRHGCARVGDRVECWGANARGQLGDGTRRSRARAAPVVDLPGRVTALAAGAHHTCAIAEGRVFCWGAGESGQIGPDDGDRGRPQRVEGLPEAARLLAAGARHSCAAAGGVVFCWGAGDEGQLGVADPGQRGPVRVEGLRGRPTALAAGSDVSCATVDGSRVACWGARDFGQRGAGRREAAVSWVGPWDDGRLRDVDGDGRMLVVCLGDSNTEHSERFPASWCRDLAELLPEGWTVVNRGLGGATATGASLRPAREQLEYALDWDRPDVLLAAFGTNDLLAGVASEEIVAALVELRRLATEGGAELFVAELPPLRTAGPEGRSFAAEVAETNELLRRAIPAERRLDLGSGFSEALLRDGVHLGAEGHARRARRALEALQAAGSPR